MQLVDASVVLAPYLEPIVRGRRVAVFGDATNPLGSALLERGARLVHVYDPDPQRVAEAVARHPSSRSLVIAPLPEGELAVRDGAFDTVLVPQLSLFERADSVVARARRLVSEQGYAVFCAPNPDVSPGAGGREHLLSYYELYDVVALQFPEVRMLGQVPFAGYIIADFAPDGEPDVVVDTSLVEQGGEEPSWFVALGTHQPRRLEPYTIVQVPRGVEPEDAAVQGAGRAQSDKLERSLREKVDELEALRQREQQQAQALKESDSRAGDNKVRAGQLEGKVRDLEEELRHQRDRAFRLSNEFEEEKKLRTKAELELGMIRRTSELPPRRETSARDAEALEQAKAEAQRLERVAGEAEQRARELAQQLEQARGRTKELEAELETLRDELDDLRAAAKQADDRVAELRRGLASRDARLKELDATVVSLQEAAGKATDGAGREHAELKRQLERVTRELDRAVRAGESKSAERDRREQATQRSREQVEQVLRERDEANTALEAMRGEQEREVGSLERALRERGQEIRRLQDAVAHHEALAGELILQLERSIAADAPSEGGSAAALRVQIEQLATACAQREAELQTARWRVAELEGRVQELTSTAVASPGQQSLELEHALFAAQSELDALRQALQSERAARQRAEAQSRLVDEGVSVQAGVVLAESAPEGCEPETEAS